MSVSRNISPLGFVYTKLRDKSGLKSKDYGECTVNAICSLTGLPYKDVREDIALVNAISTKIYKPKTDYRGNKISKYWIGKKTFRYGTLIGAPVFEEYIKELGLKFMNIRKHKVLSLSDAHKMYGDCVVTIMLPDFSCHSCTVKKGKVYDYVDYRVVLWEGEWLKHKNMKDYFTKQGATLIKKEKTIYNILGVTEPYVTDVLVEA